MEGGLGDADHMETEAEVKVMSWRTQEAQSPSRSLEAIIPAGPMILDSWSPEQHISVTLSYLCVAVWWGSHRTPMATGQEAVSLWTQQVDTG